MNKLLLAALLLPITANAETIRFEWPHPDPKGENISKFNLYCNNSGTMEVVAIFDRDKDSEATIFNIDAEFEENKGYSCIVTAINNIGNESDPTPVFSFYTGKPTAPASLKGAADSAIIFNANTMNVVINN